ncbi:MAG: short-chain dehydrogenase [Methylibium sp. NZG]|nr:MAG: short-chain dehydrogenase [Methylibium sp. NZG]
MSPSPSTWFITGASRGLGAAIARAALRAGHRVAATGRDAAAVQAALASDASDRLLALTLDVTQPAQALQAVGVALDRFGRIDVLVNNAGYGQMGMFEEVDGADIQAQFDTNVFGLMHVTRAVLPTMRAQRSGHVFNVSSIGGQVGFAGASLYCATKFAVEGFSASLAPEVAPFGIRVTAVAPGFFRTDFLDPRSIRYGSAATADYADASAALRDTYDGYSHQQAGDPEKLAAALLTLATHPKPPLNFVVGADAVGMALGEIERLRGEVAGWRTLSEATACD